MNIPIRRVIRAIGLLAAVSAGPALAQQQDSSNPFYVGVNGGYSHVSNVFRQDGGNNADNVLTASLLGGVDLRFGRQHLRADASITASKYSRNTDLNNLGYNGQLALDWSTVERIQGTVTVSGSERLADYNIATNLAPVYSKNTQTDWYADSVTYVGLVTRWSLMVDVNARRVRYSAPEYAMLNYDLRTWAIGPSWQPSPDLRLGVDWRHSQGTYPTYFSKPTGGYDSNEYSRNDLDLVVNWQISGHNRIDARIGTGRYPSADTSGHSQSVHSGLATWRYDPTSKISMITTFVRDQGLNSYSYFGLGASLNQTSKTDLLMFQPSYQVTSKIAVNGSVSYARTRQDNDVLGTNISAYNDNNRGVSLGASYAYSRGISSSCQLSRQARRTSVAGYSYTANSFGCTAQFLFF